MARPHKARVDYFPHDTNASKRRTLSILQSEYGNDGYAFWFKLLELLGDTDGHVYDYNKPADWKYLLTQTHVSEDIATGILSTLIDLEAIDPDLAKKKIIWCQHFVDNVADVYKRRQTDLPLRPGDHAKPGKAVALNDYLAEIRPDYQDLDIDDEMVKFNLYWSEGDRKLKRPKLALRNWLDKARKHQGTTSPVEEHNADDDWHA